MAESSRLACRMDLVDASGIRKVFELAAKLDNPINFSIGQPDFDVPEACKEAAIEAIRRGSNRYTVTQGEAALREAVRGRLAEEFGTFEAPLLITSGVSGGILLALLATVNPGDEVLIPDPYFVMYKHLVNLIGATPVFVDTYPDFRLRADRLEAAVTERTRMLVLNSPTNPTGAVYTEQEVAGAVEVARRHGLVVLSDEIYNLFSYDGPSPTPWPLYDRVILLRGFSKTHAMTGWRMGYAAGPAEVIGAMTTLQQYTFVCAPSPLQWGAVAALETDTTDLAQSFRARRDLVYEGLSKRFEVVRPGGAFYIFPEAPGGSGTAFCARAIESGVLVIPGNVFSERDTHFRISYVAEPAAIERGLEVLSKVAEQMA